MVDDEEGIRTLFEQVLTPMGFRVHVATNGKEASGFLASEEVDLVITDLVMPNPGGIETIQGIRRDHPKIKIIAMSGAFGGQFLETAKLLGADMTMAKPVSPRVLEQTVRELLS